MSFRTEQDGAGSVRFGYGSWMGRFERFRFSVLTVPFWKGFSSVSVLFTRKGRFRFRFLKNGSDGSGSSSGFWKNGSDCSGFRFQFGSWAILTEGGAKQHLTRLRDPVQESCYKLEESLVPARKKLEEGLAESGCTRTLPKCQTCKGWQGDNS